MVRYPKNVDIGNCCLVDNFERPTVDVSSREKKEEGQRELHGGEKENA